MTAGGMGKRKILLIANTSWYIFNFRRRLIGELLRQGYGVVAVAPPDEYSERVAALGCAYVPLPMRNKGKNPLADAVLFSRVLILLARERPLCVLSYTVKPNAYVSLAGRALGIPVIVNIAGLGSVFVTHTWLTALVGTLYKIAFYGSHCVFFQNRDDLEYFVGNGIVSASAARVLPGSGVDIDRFLPSLPTSAGDGRFRFLLLGRLLWEKGVGDYMGAARGLKLEHPEAEFHLMGFVEVDSPSAISRRQIDKWKAEGIVIFHEASDDVIPWIANADCVILPSYYREGTPRALLEAASMGKPLITTDMPGCRDTVEDGKTGYLVRPRDVGDLIEKMENMLRLPAEDRRKMGLRGRAKMIREFDERIVLGKYLEVIREIQSREV